MIEAIDNIYEFIWDTIETELQPLREKILDMLIIK